MKCPYCKREAKLVKGSEIYCGRKHLADKNYWECLPCDAHVGCHGDSEIPLGTLANQELRLMRSEAHRVFDQLWGSQKRSRSAAYVLLKRHFHLTEFECHIGLFNKQQCAKVIQVCKIQLELEKK